MKIALVTCFNADWHRGRIPHPYIPLNLLSLGATLRNAGHEVVVIDQTLLLTQGKVDDGPAFHDQAARIIAEERADVVGLTTMCNSYPQTLRLAQRYRHHDPAAKLILGGPQATVVDEATLREFPWIDAVVRNEADVSLLELVDCWAQGYSDINVLGVTWRDRNGQIHRNANAPLLQDMDLLPFPAYDLYPVHQTGEKLIPVEAGRGCPYGCTFCSTNLFFNRRYRIKSPERLIAEMQFLYDTYGYADFDLVHDMMTVDRRWVDAFCEALIGEKHQFKWGCSARVDRVDQELLAKMSEAGCMGMFFGVETGSQRLQPIVKKKLDVAEVLPIMRACVDLNIGPTGSMITGFPEETIDDMLDSFNLALDILQISPNTRAQMHMLAPLVGSPLYNQYKDQLHFDGHSSDISLFLLSDDEIEMVRRYPDIFPNFYYIPTLHLDRDLVKLASAGVYTCADLFMALRFVGADIKTTMTGWIAWQRSHVPQERIGQDYYMYYFGMDFCRYLRAEVLASLSDQAPFLIDLVNYFELRYALQRGHMASTTTFQRFDYDVQHFIKQLREGKPLLPPERQPSDLLFINFFAAAEYGYAYLEVKVPRNDNPPVLPGDELEVRDLIKQLVTRPNIIIRNNTQKRIFATKHHLTHDDLQAMRLLQVA